VEDFPDDDFFVDLRVDFFDEDFFDDDFFAGGTLPPSRRASDNPMAMACLRLFTFFPLDPDSSVPRFLSCIAFSTFSDAFSPYLAMLPPFLSLDAAARKVHNIGCCYEGSIELSPVSAMAGGES
jgi:hypothetical protein